MERTCWGLSAPIPPRQDQLLSLILSSMIPSLQQTRLKLYHVPGSCGSHGLSFQLKVSLLCVTEAAPPSLITSLHPGSGLPADSSSVPWELIARGTWALPTQQGRKINIKVAEHHCLYVAGCC